MTRSPRYLALCGGVGGAKLADGLARVVPAGSLTVAVNVGDDFDHLGLTICPDLDTVCYALAGLENNATGWGRDAESWRVMDAVQALGGPDWFRLGDKDLALHLLRGEALARGVSLSEVTRTLCERLGAPPVVTPVSDQPVRTRVLTDAGWLAFQHYFVERRCEPRALQFEFQGAMSAVLAPRLRAALDDPDLAGIVICPSNPYVSIGPMLAIPALTQALSLRRCPAIAVSPIIGGDTLKGPAAKMMREFGLPVTALAVARHYGPLIDGLLLDEIDAHELEQRDEADPLLRTAATVMRSRADRDSLARACIDWLAALSASPSASSARTAGAAGAQGDLAL